MTLGSKYLQFGRRILVKILKHNELLRIKMPSHDKLKEYCQMIHLRHPALDNVWGSMDGLKVPIEQPSDSLVQTRFYYGWKCAHYVTAVLCFVPDGTIPAAFYNVCGVCHDSQVADWGNIYNKVEKVYHETGLILHLAVQTSNTSLNPHRMI